MIFGETAWDAALGFTWCVMHAITGMVYVYWLGYRTLRTHASGIARVFAPIAIASGMVRLAMVVFLGFCDGDPEVFRVLVIPADGLALLVAVESAYRARRYEDQAGGLR